MNGRNIWRWSLVAAVAFGACALWRATSQPAVAQGGAASNCCVGVLRLNEVLNKLDEKAIREGELEAFIKSKEAEIRALMDQMKAMADELKLIPKDSPDLMAKKVEYARFGARVKIEQELAEVTAIKQKQIAEVDMFNKIRAAAADVAQRKGLAVIINDDSGIEIPDNAEYRDVQAAMVTRRAIYADTGVDISSEVANYMNNEFKATGRKGP